MDPETARIKQRMERVLNSIYCPVHGCWPAHGCHYEYYYDSGAGCHVLEVWPVSVDEPDRQPGNWYGDNQRGQQYELADFEFSGLAREISLKHLHFSQRRAVFEIGWREDGLNLALKVHIEPLAMGTDGPAELDV